MNNHYDFIFAGGGCAGLSLAYAMSQTEFRDRAMLIIDPVVKAYNDHTWCYWSREPSPFDALAYRTWDRIAFIAAGFAREFDLAPYRYRMVRGLDFYRHTREALTALPNVDFLRGEVERVVDAAGPEKQRAEVLVNALTFTGDWVFDSRYRATEYRPLTRRYHYLTQHFLGWEIETAAPVFDPATPRMFDFRTPQRGAMRFVYVLPYDARRGLVEYTLFSKDLLPLAEYEDALRAYIADVLGAREYRILEEERDLIPMTEHPAERRAGQRVLNIGTRGGRVKASTGYAFLRIQRDAAAIIRSLRARGHPFHLPAPPRRYRTFDAILLDILQYHGDLGQTAFTAMFRNNPLDRLFRFLDEEGDVYENLRLMASVPSWPFIRAWIHLHTRRLR